MNIRLNGYSGAFEGFSKKYLLQVIIALVLILMASKYVIHQFAWKVSGPISLVIGFVFITFFLKKHRLKWQDLGFKKDKFHKVFLWFVFTMIISAFVILFGDQIADLFFTKAPRANDRFGDLSGNIPLTLAWIITGIIIGGFGEELVYRGFMINALENVIGRKYGVIIAIVLPALFWGLRHYYYASGHGAIMVFIMGIFLGSFYVLNGRNLLPGIILHAAFDTISFLARYDGG